MATYKYRGFTQFNINISGGVHEGNAVDLSAPWGFNFFAPYRSDKPNEKRKFWCIRMNRIDSKYGDVRYSVIQDVTDDGADQPIFGYFHTAVSVWHDGDYIYSGTTVTQNAPNGIFKGAHLHLATYLNKFSNRVNPLPWLDIIPGGSHGLGILIGQPVQESHPEDPLVALKKQNLLQCDIIEQAVKQMRELNRL
jgi:hypothetical protein